MGKKRPNKAEREHIGRVVEIGCIACLNMGFPGTPAEYHHLLTGAGMGQRASHCDGIGLCPHHHRTGGHGIAIHAGIKTWEGVYGTELELLEQVSGLL